MSRGFNFTPDEDSKMLLTDQFFTQAILTIAKGDAVEGDSFPGARELSADYEVAYGTAAKVISMLKAEKYVKTKHGTGITVNVQKEPERAFRELKEILTIELAKCKLKGVKLKDIQDTVGEIWEQYQ